MPYIGDDISARTNPIPPNNISYIYTTSYTYFLNNNIEDWDRNTYIFLGDGDVFNGNGYTINVIDIDDDDDNFSYGIFATDNANIPTAPIIRDLTINSIVVDQSINDGTGGGGGFMQSGSNKFELHNCVHNGKISSSNSGGFFCQPDITTSNNIIINSCIQNGDISDVNIIDNISNVIGSGGFCGGGIANGCTNNNDFYINFTDCTFNGNLYGDNSGGFCGASQNDINTIGGGCIGNGINNNTIFGVNININVNFVNCVSNGNLYGKNSGGICGGSDNYNIGGGCIGNGINNNTNISGKNISNISINFINCKSVGTLNNKNCGGICGGGDNINDGTAIIRGGGCIGNGSTSSYSSIDINFNNCISIGDNILSPNLTIPYNNCGGICGGGDNINDNNYGAGCICNSSSANILITFKDCKSESTLNNKNCGGICAGGDNYLNSTYDNNNNYGAGCIGNSNINNINNINIDFTNCTSIGDLLNSNCGGICGGGDNIAETNNNNNSFNLGSGCIGNNSINNLININFINCTSSGNYNVSAIQSNQNPINELFTFNSNPIIYANCGGICAGGNNINKSIINNVIINNGSGCIGNYSDNSITIKFIKCISNGNIYNLNSGGICGGGNNTNGNGSGCIGNNSSSLNTNSIDINFTDCIFNGEIYSINCGGICGGGNNDYGYGGGCIANNSNGLNININFNDCVSNANLNANNCGGICAGGDNNVDCNGGGCIGNHSNGINNNNNINININFNNCISNGNLIGNNCGGICAGGDNYGNGGGCIGNASGTIGDLQLNNISINFNNCKSIGDYYGKNCGGICSSGDNKDYDDEDDNISNGGGCIGNYSKSIFNINFIDCVSIGNFYMDNCGGICSGGDNYGNGGGCIGNYSIGSVFTISFVNCTSTGNINSNNCGGFIAGGNNDGNGGGCIGNGGNIIGTEDPIEPFNIYNIQFINCIFTGNIINNINTSSGGFCGSGNNNAIGGGCIGNNSDNNSIINVEFINCKSISNISAINSGGFCGGTACIGNLSNYTTINVKFLSCEHTGDITGAYSGGICGGGLGCIGYESKNNSTINVLFEDSKSKGNIGNIEDSDIGGIGGIGGICGGANDDGGCIGNRSSGNINVVFNNINFEGNINSINSGGICGGSGTGGCIGTTSSGNINVLFNNINIQSNINSINSGGICGGGSVGCIANNAIGIVIVEFNNINFTGDIGNIDVANNCGGLCGGGDGGCIGNGYNTNSLILNSLIKVTCLNCKVTDNGNILKLRSSNTGGLFGGSSTTNGGCIGNNLCNNIDVYIKDCITNVNLYGDNNGGLFGGSICNYVSSSDNINPLNVNVNITITDCQTLGNIIGNNIGGLIGSPNSFFNNISLRSDDIFNARIDICNNTTNTPILNNYSGGIISGNIFNNNIINFNTKSSIYMKIYNCISNGDIDGTY